MDYNYESEIEEPDEGYSIPKILVAILLLLLIGAGSYIFFKQKKLNASITYLLDSKKQAERDLNEMIEKYNLAIEDNGSLEGDLFDERDQLIRFRDSIKKIKKSDFKKENNFQNAISNLKKKSSVKSISSFVDNRTKTSSSSTTITTTEELKNDGISILESDYVEQPEIKTNTTNETISTNTINIKPKKGKDASIIIRKEKEKPVGKTRIMFNHVETPPKYPGCSGSVVEKKLCFAEKIKKHLSRKFDTSIIESLNLKPGQKRIWINFDINKKGNIVNVTARAPNNVKSKAKIKLEEEAIRLVKILPRMTPAKQNGETVNINYTVPLTIVVQ